MSTGNVYITCNKCKKKVLQSLCVTKRGLPSKKCPTCIAKFAAQYAKQDEKRKGRDRSEQYKFYDTNKRDKKTAKLRNKVSRRYVKWRQKKRAEDPESYRKRTSETHKKWADMHYDRVREINKKHKNTLTYNVSTCKRTADERGFEYSLNDSAVELLTNSPCEYCGDKPTEPNGMGIDRIDNTKGYVIGNVCSCCEMCNFMKLTLTYENFIHKLVHIATYLGLVDDGILYPHVRSKSYDFNHDITSYIDHAIDKDIPFELDSDQVDEMVEQDCYICGSSPFVEGKYYYNNGIDRVDNSKGYIYDNCEPCCSACNYMKKHRTYEEFLSQCKKIAMKQIPRIKRIRHMFDIASINIDVDQQQTPQRQYHPDDYYINESYRDMLLLRNENVSFMIFHPRSGRKQKKIEHKIRVKNNQQKRDKKLSDPKYCEMVRRMTIAARKSNLDKHLNEKKSEIIITIEPIDKIHNKCSEEHLNKFGIEYLPKYVYYRHPSGGRGCMFVYDHRDSSIMFSTTSSVSLTDLEKYFDIINRIYSHVKHVSGYEDAQRFKYEMSILNPRLDFSDIGTLDDSDNETDSVSDTEDNIEDDQHAINISDLTDLEHTDIIIS